MRPIFLPLVSKFDDSGIKAAQRQFGGMRKQTMSLTRVFNRLAIATTAFQAIRYIQKSITNASDLNEQISASQQVFGKSTKIIDEFAQGAVKNLFMTKTQVYSAAKSFGVYGKAAGLTSSKNAKFSTELVKLAADLASFNNVSTDEALTALGAGLRGESEPLRKFGVLITETSMKNKGMELGLGTLTKTAKGFTYSMNEQEKILARNALIFEQTITQQGDAARTADGFANQQRKLQAALSDASAELGSSFLPIATEFITYLNDTAVPVLSNFFKELRDPKSDAGKVFMEIKDSVQQLGDKLSEVFGKFDPSGKGNGLVGVLQLIKTLLDGINLAIDALSGKMLGEQITETATTIALTGQTARWALEGKKGPAPTRAGASKFMADLLAGINPNSQATKYAQSQIPYGPPQPQITINTGIVTNAHDLPKYIAEELKKFNKRNGTK